MILIPEEIKEDDQQDESMHKMAAKKNTNKISSAGGCIVRRTGGP